MTFNESEMQRVCVRWFRLQYRDYASLLYAVPNGGRRGKVTAAIMKGEGVVAGVSDLNLDIPRGGYHGLRIEMKLPSGRQSDSQKEWQRAVESQGYLYVVCHSVADFTREVGRYMDGRQ